MALTPILITWGTGTAPVVNPDGSSPSGAVQLTLVDGTTLKPVTIEDTGTGETVLPTPIIGQLVSGQLLALPVGGGPYTPLSLIANDDPTTEPTGTCYLVHEELVAGSIPDWQFTVHHASAGGTESIASQRPT